MAFLGFLIDTVKQVVCVPVNKVAKGLNMISFVLDKCNKKRIQKSDHGIANTTNLWILKFSK